MLAVQYSVEALTLNKEKKKKEIKANGETIELINECFPLTLAKIGFEYSNPICDIQKMQASIRWIGIHSVNNALIKVLIKLCISR